MSLPTVDHAIAITLSYPFSTEYHGAMKIATGKVVGGKVEVDGALLEEGASVTVLARDGENGFTLSPEEEAELLLSIAEADRGETISAEEVLAKLAGRRG